MNRKRFRDERGRKTDWGKTHREASIVFGWDMERVPGEQEQKSDGPTWTDVEAVWPRLHKGERVILQLVRSGKTPTDVAEILNLSDKRRAYDAVMRTVGVVRFYMHWSDALERLSSVALRPKDRRVAILYARHRMPYKKIATKVGCADKHVHVILQRVRDKMREAGEDDVADMLTECGATYMGKRTEEVDVADNWREDVAVWLVGHLGKVFYEWGAQNIRTGVADCSGLVIEVFKKFGVLPDGFRDMAAVGLARHFDKTTKSPMPGDLVFYGKSTKTIVHVMIYVGEVDGHEDMVAGMCGGKRNMEVDWATKVGAGLWLRKMKYRRDFLYCRKVG